MTHSTSVRFVRSLVLVTFEQFGATFCRPQIDYVKMNFDNEDNNCINEAVMILYSEDPDNDKYAAHTVKEEPGLTDVTSIYVMSKST